MTSAHLKLALYGGCEVSEDGAAVLANVGTAFEEVHATNGGRLTDLLVAGGEPFHHCIEEPSLGGGRGGRGRTEREGEWNEQFCTLVCACTQ